MKRTFEARDVWCYRRIVRILRSGTFRKWKNEITPIIRIKKGVGIMKKDDLKI